MMQSSLCMVLVLTTTIRRGSVCCEALLDRETPISIARISTCRKSIATKARASLQIAELTAWCVRFDRHCFAVNLRDLTRYPLRNNHAMYAT